jgi:hypothetical protein
VERSSSIRGSGANVLGRTSSTGRSARPPKGSRLCSCDETLPATVTSASFALLIAQHSYMHNMHVITAPHSISRTKTQKSLLQRLLVERPHVHAAPLRKVESTHQSEDPRLPAQVEAHERRRMRRQAVRSQEGVAMAAHVALARLGAGRTVCTVEEGKHRVR